MTLYSFNLVRSTKRNFTSAYQQVAADGNALLRSASCWGAFSGLFGIGSNEFVLMLSGDEPQLVAAAEHIESDTDASIATTYLFEPTVRPTEPVPITRPGLYVFRFFDVAHDDIDEVARLSREAWETFENTSDYQAEPQGLFCEHHRAGDAGKMLLLTWYDGLGSWQASRAPNPEARANFVRRHELTRGTVAYATRLIDGNST